MRRWMLISILLGVGLLVGCTTGPREKAEQWADYFPETISGHSDPDEDDSEMVTFWELDDRDQLTEDTHTGSGHVILTYEGDDDAVAYVNIRTYPTESAANLALLDAMQDWQLRGVRFETERTGGTRFEYARFAGGALIFYQEVDTIITVAAVTEDPADEIPQNSLFAFIETMVQILEQQ